MGERGTIPKNNTSGTYIRNVNELRVPFLGFAYRKVLEGLPVAEAERIKHLTDISLMSWNIAQHSDYHPMKMFTALAVTKQRADTLT